MKTLYAAHKGIQGHITQISLLYHLSLPSWFNLWIEGVATEIIWSYTSGKSFQNKIHKIKFAERQEKEMMLLLQKGSGGGYFVLEFFFLC